MTSFQLRNVSLSYPVYRPVDLTVKGTLPKLAVGGTLRESDSGRIEVSALSDITLSAKEGDRIGLIGHNGAGKTTLLKVLAGVYRPQKGYLRREGRTMAIINPSNGLQPELDGYTNIENIGLLYGMSLADIRGRVAEIAEFAELGDFMSLPVSTYSTGMMARLAFSVATALDPQILIADENLSTGDARFVERARLRMERMMERSSILVLASHDMRTLSRLCNRGVHLERGHIAFEGSMDDAIASYNAPR